MPIFCKVNGLDAKSSFAHSSFALVVVVVFLFAWLLLFEREIKFLVRHNRAMHQGLVATLFLDFTAVFVE